MLAFTALRQHHQQKPNPSNQETSSSVFVLAVPYTHRIATALTCKARKCHYRWFPKAPGEDTHPAVSLQPCPNTRTPPTAKPVTPALLPIKH